MREHMTFDIVPESVTRAGFDDLREGDRSTSSCRCGSAIASAATSSTDTSMRRAAIAGELVEGQGHRLTIERPGSVARYIEEKGFIAIDGVSLTIASVTPDYFTIALIPETSRRYDARFEGRRRPGERRIDPVARYAFAAMDEYRGASESGRCDRRRARPGLTRSDRLTRRDALGGNRRARGRGARDARVRANGADEGARRRRPGGRRDHGRRPGRRHGPEFLDRRI